MANKIQKVGARKNKIIFYLADNEKIMAENYAESQRLRLSSLIRKMILDVADEYILSKKKEN